MITTIAEYQCDICKRVYENLQDAIQCEYKPEQFPSLSVGDVVYIRIRGIYEFVKDSIVDIKKDGHNIYYITKGKYGWHKRYWEPYRKWTDEHISEKDVDSVGVCMTMKYPLCLKNILSMRVQ